MLPDAVKKEPVEDKETPAPVRQRLKLSSVWQMLLILALILIAIIGLCQVTGLSSKLRPLPTSTPTPLPTATPPPTATHTPTLVPTPTATPQPQITPGGRAVVQDTGGQKLRLRAGPGLTQQVLASLDDGTEVRVLEGPQTADGYEWWKVQTADGTVGWAAANWLAPIAP